MKKTHLFKIISAAFIVFSLVIIGCEFQSTSSNIAYQGSNFEGSSGGAGGGVSDNGIVPTINSAADSVGTSCYSMQSCRFTCTTSKTCGPYHFYGYNFIAPANSVEYTSVLTYLSGSQSAAAGATMNANCTWISSSHIACSPVFDKNSSSTDYFSWTFSNTEGGSVTLANVLDEVGTSGSGTAGTSGTAGANLKR